MSKENQFDKKLLLECLKVATGGQKILCRHDADLYFATAMDIYNFIENQKLGVLFDLGFTDDLRSLWIEKHPMTYLEILEDYKRLKSKELAEEANKSQDAANDSDPLESGIKQRKTLLSRLFG